MDDEMDRTAGQQRYGATGSANNGRSTTMDRDANTGMHKDTENSMNQDKDSGGTGSMSQNKDAGTGSQPAKDGSGWADGITEEIKERSGDIVDKAQEGIDSGREKAASGIRSAADNLKERAGSAEGLQQDASMKVAEGMETAASYLQEHSTEEILTDLEQFVKEHPGQAIVGAVVAGFLIGRVLR